MAYNIVSNNDNVTYGIRKFIVDEKNDLENLPYGAAPGSKAYITGTQDIYILDNNNTWVPYKCGNGGTGSGTDEPPEPGDNIYIWDGGEI